MRHPATITPMTDTTVNIIPSLPAARDSNRFIPNPSPTTATWKRYFETFFENVGKGFPRVRARKIPANRAIAGETNTDAASRMTKTDFVMISFISLLFSGRKNMKYSNILYIYKYYIL